MNKITTSPLVHQIFKKPGLLQTSVMLRGKPQHFVLTGIWSGNCKLMAGVEETEAVPEAVAAQKAGAEPDIEAEVGRPSTVSFWSTCTCLILCPRKYYSR